LTSSRSGSAGDAAVLLALRAAVLLPTLAVVLGVVLVFGVLVSAVTDLTSFFFGATGFLALAAGLAFFAAVFTAALVPALVAGFAAALLGVAFLATGLLALVLAVFLRQRGQQVF
jgi:uncharacterized membrane protein